LCLQQRKLEKRIQKYREVIDRVILGNTEKCSLMASRFSVFFIKFNRLQQFLFLQFPKGDCTGSGDIEGVDASGHGDNDIVIYRLKGR